MPEKENFSDQRQATHLGALSTRAKLGKSTKEVDEDLQAVKQYLGMGKEPDALKYIMNRQDEMYAALAARVEALEKAAKSAVSQPKTS